MSFIVRLRSFICTKVGQALENENFSRTTARLRYDIQCCGFVAEMIQSDYNVDKERQFRFSIQLANIGSMGSFGGQEAVAGNRGFLSGR